MRGKERVLIVGMGSAGRRAAQWAERLGFLVCWCDVRTEVDIPLDGQVKWVRVPTVEAGLLTRPHLVYVATPPHRRVTVIAQACAAKVPAVLIEKPIAMTLEAALEIQLLVESFPETLTTVGYQLRLEPAVQAVKARPIRHAEIWDQQNMATWPPATYPRDLFLEFSHEIDLARYWIGPIGSVQVRPMAAMAYEILVLAKDGIATATIRLSASHIGYARGAELDYGGGEGVSWRFDLDINRQLYGDELVAVLDGQQVCPVGDAVEVLRIIDAVRRSIDTSEWEAVR